MTHRREKLEALFEAAAALETDGQRAEYLARACPDTALRKEVESLLDAMKHPDSLFADDPATRATTMTELPVLERPGTMVGRYKLLQKIGEGGMGVVYMAEQEEPVRRKVALKIIKLGMDTRQVVARFEAERQALALMDHPHIAKVLDAGATETGRPYFVMELVKGIPITQYCDKNGLSTRDRLGLFIPVCQAIQHAHQKGIIHRDIKPSNVLVALFDGKPVPMVIDFGVAKATNHRLTEKTLFTDFAQMIGTPAYMSPEQAEMSQLDVDTRSDVYSLGILLYELLTGGTPFTDQQLRKAGWAGMQRIIAEEEPAKPSTRLSTMTLEEQSDIGKKHREDPKKLSLLLRRELDWIVMKALEKDRTRRYETANGLAADVRRYLTGDAPEAAPPSWAYQFRKLARKHKATFAMAASIAVILTAATGFSTWQAVVASRERARADREAAVAKAINNFFNEEILGQGDVWMAESTPHADLTLRDVVLRASEKVEGSFPEAPIVEASIREVLGNVLGGLGDVHPANAHRRAAYRLFREQLGPEARETIRIQAKLGVGLGEGFEEYPGEGYALLQSALKAQTRILGERDPDTIDTIGRMGLWYLNAGNYDGGVFDVTGADYALLEKAGDYLSRAIELKEQVEGPHPGWLNVLSAVRAHQGRIAETRRLLLKYLERVERKQGQSSVWFADGLYELSCNLQWWFDRDDKSAAATLEQALGICRSLELRHGWPRTIIEDTIALMGLCRSDFEFCTPRYLEIEQGLLASRGQGQLATMFWNLVAQNVLGDVGDWERLMKRLESQRQEGWSQDSFLALELLARHFTGDTNQTLELRELLWDLDTEKPESLPTTRSATVLLTLPMPGDERVRLLDLAERAAQAQRADARGQLRAALARGMAAYRGSDYAQAEAYLFTVSQSRDLPQVAALAHFFLAMTYAQLGREAAARQTLASAIDALNRLLTSGNLGMMDYRVFEDLYFDIEGRETFGPTACSLIARDEAETLILGTVTTSPVTAATLQASRERWQQLHPRLLEATLTARRRQYTQAARLFVELFADPAFSLPAGEQPFHGFPGLGQGMAATFLLAGETINYAKVCRLAYAGINTNSLDRLTMLVLRPGVLSAELAELASTLAPEWALESIHSDHPQYRSLLDLGMVRYRQGRLEDAATALDKAAESTNRNWSTLARVFAAMTYHRLGQETAAAEHLKHAEAGWNTILEYGGGMLFPYWHDQVTIDLMLKEARQLMERPFAASKESRGG